MPSTINWNSCSLTCIRQQFFYGPRGTEGILEGDALHIFQPAEKLLLVNITKAVVSMDCIGQGLSSQ